MIRIGIVAPTAAVRAGLSALLQEDPSFNVVGQAASLPGLPMQQPDVLIYYPGDDPSRPAPLPPEPSLDAVGEHPAAILVITSDPEVFAAIRRSSFAVAGALLPDMGAEELQAAVKALAEGLITGSPYLIEKAFGEALPLSTPEFEERSPLTQREVEILQLLSRGLANKQIADTLKISPHTVKFHIGSIYQKMGATNRAEAVRLGIQQGRLTL